MPGSRTWTGPNHNLKTTLMKPSPYWNIYLSAVFAGLLIGATAHCVNADPGHHTVRYFENLAIAYDDDTLTVSSCNSAVYLGGIKIKRKNHDLILYIREIGPISSLGPPPIKPPKVKIPKAVNRVLLGRKRVLIWERSAPPVSQSP